MKPRRILIVAPYSTLPNDRYVNRFSHLATALGDRGHAVVFCTSSFSHSQKRKRCVKAQNEHKNVSTVLIDEPGYINHVGLSRIRSLRRFTRNFKAAFATFDKFDVVYSAYPPIATNRYIAHTIDRKKTRFILDIQDVWPESFSAVMPWISRLPLWVLPFSRTANKVYSSADALVAVSQTYLDRARMVAPAIRALVAYIGSEFFIRNNAPLRGTKVKFFYIGTISYSYDIETVMKAVHHLNEKKSRIELHIYGDGPNRKALAAKNYRGSVFYGAIPYRALEKSIRAKHVGVNCINSQAPQTVTNKLCDYLALGCPILNSQVGDEVESLVNQSLHSNYRSGDVRSAAAAIEALMREDVLFDDWVFNKEFSRQASTKKIISLIEDH